MVLSDTSADLKIMEHHDNNNRKNEFTSVILKMESKSVRLLMHCNGILCFVYRMVTTIH